ncbi:MAG TPA: dihydrofolate reductase [Patescibacteria group bacterium]|nr:dihydrofolate reductase [Patescibacteria group bacterium]
MKNTAIPQPLPTSKIVIVAAIAKNNVIGSNNALPWHYPEELKWFKEITEGKTILMGRRTFESILAKQGKPLKKRKHIILTHDLSYRVPDGVFIYHDLKKALKDLEETIYVIGGGTVYKQTTDLAQEMYITHIDKEYSGDVFFPSLHESDWKKEVIRQTNELVLTKYLRIHL